MAPAVKNSVTKAKGRAESAHGKAKPVREHGEVAQFVSGFRKYVKEHADYVGKRFPEEARKIHYGEADERHIYGESTLKEARELIEEGIPVAPLPPEPDELN